MEFIETVNRETLKTDARRIALTIEAATARVILIFSWYIDAKEILLELAKRNVSESHRKTFSSSNIKVLFVPSRLTSLCFHCRLLVDSFWPVRP